MRWNGWMVAFLVLLGVNAGFLGSRWLARDEPPMDGPSAVAGASPRLERVADRLGLSGPKREQFLAVQSEFLRGVRREVTAAQRLQRELRAELTQDDYDPDEVRRLARQAAERRVAVELAFVDNVLASREILDGRAEQTFLRHLSVWRSRGLATVDGRARRSQARRQRERTRPNEGSSEPPSTPSDGVE